MISEFKKIHPEYFEFFEELIKNPSPKEIENIFKKSPKLNINQAISEKSKKMLVIPTTFNWSDVGEWKSIYKQLKTDLEGNVSLENKTPFIGYKSKNCLVKSSDKKIIGLVGVENLAVIDTPDALLICNMDKSADVRHLITKIVEKKKYKDFFLKSHE